MEQQDRPTRADLDLPGRPTGRHSVRLGRPPRPPHRQLPPSIGRPANQRRAGPFLYAARAGLWPRRAADRISRDEIRLRYRRYFSPLLGCHKLAADDSRYPVCPPAAVAGHLHSNSCARRSHKPDAANNTRIQTPGRLIACPITGDFSWKPARRTDGVANKAFCAISANPQGQIVRQARQG